MSFAERAIQAAADRDRAQKIAAIAQAEESYRWAVVRIIRTAERFDLDVHPEDVTREPGAFCRWCCQVTDDATLELAATYTTTADDDETVNMRMVPHPDLYPDVGRQTVRDLADIGVALQRIADARKRRQNVPPASVTAPLQRMPDSASRADAERQADITGKPVHWRDSRVLPDYRPGHTRHPELLTWERPIDRQQPLNEQ